MEYNTGSITVMVADFNKSVDFYTKTLGLALKARYGDGYAEVEAPGLVIGLHPAGSHLPPRSEGISIGLQVPDIDAAKRELESRGVAFPNGIRDTEELRIAHFADPDGTALNIIQMKRRG